jgi:outer membrane protein assembly factor BamB
MTTAWRAPLSAAVEGPLATDGARIFAASRDGVLKAVEVRSGAPLWELPDRPGVVEFGAGTLVLRGPDGMVSAIEPGTGRTRWRTPTGVTGSLPPVIYKDVVVVGGQGLTALNLDTGRPVWSDADARVTAAPVAWGPWLLVGEGEGALRCRDAATGTALWSFATTKPLLAPPVVDPERRVLLGTTDRRFVALDVDDKGDPHWSWRLGAGIQNPPAVLADLVLFTTHEDVLYGLKRSNGHIIWRASLPSRPLSGPVMRGEAAVVACYGARPGETFLVAFDGRTGERLGDVKAPGEIRTAPLLAGDLLVMGLAERAVVAMRLGAIDAPEP